MGCVNKVNPTKEVVGSLPGTYKKHRNTKILRDDL